MEIQHSVHAPVGEQRQWNKNQKLAAWKAQMQDSRIGERSCRRCNDYPCEKGNVVPK